MFDAHHRRPPSMYPHDHRRRRHMRFCELCGGYVQGRGYQCDHCIQRGRHYTDYQYMQPCPPPGYHNAGGGSQHNGFWSGGSIGDLQGQSSSGPAVLDEAPRRCRVVKKVAKIIGSIGVGVLGNAIFGYISS